MIRAKIYQVAYRTGILICLFSFTPATTKATNLLLSQNLCLKSADSVKIKFSKHFVAHYGAESSQIDRLNDKLKNGRIPYFSAIENTNQFSGFFLRGQTYQILNKGFNQSNLADNGLSHRRVIALDWNLLKNGKNSSRKKQEESQLARQIRYYQLLMDMERKTLNENLFRIQEVRQQAIAEVYKQEAKFLLPLIKRYQFALEQGYVTQEEVAQRLYEYARATKNIDSRMPHEQDAYHLSQHEFKLINQLESISLPPTSSLLKAAIKKSYNYALQDIFIKRSELFTSRTDNTTLRLSLEQYPDINQTVADVNVSIPLETETNEHQLANMEKQAYFNQKLAIALRLKQKILLLVYTFNQGRTDLSLLKKESKLLERRQELACFQQDYPISTLNERPVRKAEELKLLIFENSKNILLARLTILETLTKLNTLSGKF
ncbi:MAG: hypothetical protein R8K48_05510 [Gallionella sp.]